MLHGSYSSLLSLLLLLCTARTASSARTHTLPACSSATVLYLNSDCTLARVRKLARALLLCEYCTSTVRVALHRGSGPTGSSLLPPSWSMHAWMGEGRERSHVICHGDAWPFSPLRSTKPFSTLLYCPVRVLSCPVLHEYEYCTVLYEVRVYCPVRLLHWYCKGTVLSCTSTVRAVYS